MKGKTLALVLLACGTLSLAGQKETFKLQRELKVGDVDKYQFEIKAQADTTIQMQIESRVIKVFGDGSADVKDSATQLLVTQGGKPAERMQDSLTPTVTRLDKWGVPLPKNKDTEPGIPGIAFLRLMTMSVPKELAVGDTYTFEHNSETHPGDRVNGTIKLTDVKDGIAYLAIDLDLFSTAGGSTPAKVNLKTEYDTKINRTRKGEGKATGLPNGIEATISVTRVTSQTSLSEGTS